MTPLTPSGTGRQRQIVWLGVLFVVLVGAYWYYLRPAEPPSAASNLSVQPPEPVDAMRFPESVKLDALSVVTESTEIGRNPFGFGARPAPPSPPATAFTPAPMELLPSGPPRPQGPPPIALRLTGMSVIPSSGRTMVTLRDAGSGALFQAFEGDIVDGRYRLVKVGLQSVVVSYVDGSGARTLALGG